MPFVHIHVAGSDLLPEQVHHLQREATRLMSTIMHKKAQLTAVLVEQVDPAGWAIGGEPTPVAGHIEVKITEGTNTPDEKARFVKAANDLLKGVHGPDLPAATYVVVHELPAAAWGYDGHTQEARRSAP